MAVTPEQPPINDGESNSIPGHTEEEMRLMRKWYDETSHAGRTGAEFGALREELHKATVLDFVAYHRDRDYENLIHENPLMRSFIAEQTVLNLHVIHGHKEEIGLSDDQFEKLLMVFKDDEQAEFRKRIANLEDLKALYKEANKHFSPADWKAHVEKTRAMMKEEMELQEQNIPHEQVNLSFFPKKNLD